MINVSFTYDLICRECRRVLVAGYGEVPHDMNQTTYELDQAPCPDHPEAGNRILVTVSRDHLPAVHGKPAIWQVNHLQQAIRRVIADDESAPGGWGPDVTMLEFLKQALRESEATDER